MIYTSDFLDTLQLDLARFTSCMDLSVLIDLENRGKSDLVSLSERAYATEQAIQFARDLGLTTGTEFPIIVAAANTIKANYVQGCITGEVNQEFELVNPIFNNGAFSTFLLLLDTPDSYSGQAGKIVTVNNSESGLQFSDPDTLGDFINNQFSAAQTNSNFWISGNGRIDGVLDVGGKAFNVQSHGIGSLFEPVGNSGFFAAAAFQTIASPTGNTSAVYYGSVSSVESGGAFVYSNPLISSQALSSIRDGSAVSQLMSYNASTAFFYGSTGTVSSSYGLYIQPQTTKGVSSGYGVYQIGSSDNNYFAGNIGVGTNSPVSMVDIEQPTTGPGVSAVTSGSVNVVGTLTQYLNTFKIGDPITVSGQTRTIATITDSAHLTVTANFTVNSHIPAPVLLSIGLNVGGSFSLLTTYYYVVTALTSAGETTVSNELHVTVTSSGQIVQLYWAPVLGAISYNIYRGVVSGTYTVFFNTANYQQFNDTGAAGTGGTPPGPNGALGPQAYSLSGGSIAKFYGNGNVSFPGVGAGTPAGSTFLAVNSAGNLVLSSAGITGLTGDVTGSGSGSVVTTMATVNSNVGSFSNANITVNAKGLITAASSGSAGGVTSFNTRTGAVTLTTTDVNGVAATVVGTIVSGVWQANTIGANWGGTGNNNGTNVLTFGGGNITFVGAGFNQTFTATATTSVTLPTTGTLTTRAGVETLTNKTITSSTNVVGGVTMTLGSDATGDIYYRNSSGILTRLAVGSGTNVLGISAGLPAWIAAPSVSTPNALTMNNSGSGAATGATFNGSGAVTLSYNTIGASPLVGSSSLTTIGTIGSSPYTTAGIIHNTVTTGAFTSSLIVNADITTGTIAAAKLVGTDITTVGTLSAGAIPYSLLTGTPTIPTAANPTGTQGLTIVNGSATTFMRSDAAFAFNQGLVPVNTGLWTFQSNNIVTTSTDAVLIQNSTLSTSGVPNQNTGNLRFNTHVWNTTATAADNQIDFIQKLVSTSGTTPTGTMIWSARESVSGTGGYTDLLALTNGGRVGIGTNTPSETLETNGAIRVTGAIWGNSVASSFVLSGNGSGIAYLVSFGVNSGNNGQFSFQSANGTGGSRSEWFGYTAASGANVTAALNVSGIFNSSSNWKLSGTALTANQIPMSNGTTMVVASAAGLINWQEITSTSQTIAARQGYVATSSGGTILTFTLPATAAVGDLFAIVGNGSGKWTIAQNSGQIIKMSGTTTTSGVTGSISAGTRYDTVEIICIVANTTFAVYTQTGTLNLV